MDKIEQAVIQTVTQESHQLLGYKNYATLSRRLLSLDIDLNEKEVMNWLYGRPLNDLKSLAISKIALSIISDKSSSIIEYYKERNPSTAQYLIHMLRTYTSIRIDNISSTLPHGTSAISDLIFRNWTEVVPCLRTARRPG